MARTAFIGLGVMARLVGRVGRNLDTAVSAYNALVGSLESQVMSQAKQFEDLSIDTGAKAIETLPMVDQVTRPLVKLVAATPEEAALIADAS